MTSGNGPQRNVAIASPVDASPRDRDETCNSEIVHTESDSDYDNWLHAFANQRSDSDDDDSLNAISDRTASPIAGKQRSLHEKSNSERLVYTESDSDDDDSLNEFSEQRQIESPVAKRRRRDRVPYSEQLLRELYTELDSVDDESYAFFDSQEILSPVVASPRSCDEDLD
jgi:hypothetical protein